MKREKAGFFEDAAIGVFRSRIQSGFGTRVGVLKNHT
jgi:hypothetical protein